MPGVSFIPSSVCVCPFSCRNYFIRAVSYVSQQFVVILNVLPDTMNLGCESGPSSSTYVGRFSSVYYSIFLLSFHRWTNFTPLQIVVIGLTMLFVFCSCAPYFILVTVLCYLGMEEMLVGSVGTCRAFHLKWCHLS